MIISDEYRELQRSIHDSDANYGNSSVNFAPILAELMQQTGCTELLDYGAGKGRLGDTLRDLLPRPVTTHHYDPARPSWAARPDPCDLVACIDVLEHVELLLLDAVLDDLQRVTVGAGFFTVHTGPALRILPDGRNAHIIQQPVRWWLPKLLNRFELLNYQKMEEGFWVIVQRLDPAHEE